MLRPRMLRPQMRRLRSRAGLPVVPAASPSSGTAWLCTVPSAPRAACGVKRRNVQPTFRQPPGTHVSRHGRPKIDPDLYRPSATLCRHPVTNAPRRTKPARHRPLVRDDAHHDSAQTQIESAPGRISRHARAREYNRTSARRSRILETSPSRPEDSGECDRQLWFPFAGKTAARDRSTIAGSLLKAVFMPLPTEPRPAKRPARRPAPERRRPATLVASGAQEERKAEQSGAGCPQQRDVFHTARGASELIRPRGRMTGRTAASTLLPPARATT